jgi:hypothetical protein
MVVATLVAMSGVAHAQDVDVVLYELTESVKVNGKTGTFKSSEATLLGWARRGSVICPESLNLPRCSVTVRAVGKASDETGLGPIDGHFQIMVERFNPFDAAELAVATGSLKGQIDLSPLFLRETPLGSATGQFELKGMKDTQLENYKAKGDFTATFRLPVPHNGVISYMMDDGTYESVQPEETALSIAAVRVELRLK